MFGVKPDLKIHFVGIGGIGMSGIAEILINMGYKVSGSDMSQNANVEKLKKIGAVIFAEHKGENVVDTQILVYSSAITESNPEIKRARELKIPVIKRAEMLAELMRLKFGIAVAGSHGKTTTTSFLSTILKELDFKPTCIVGGIVKNLGGQALSGDGKYLVAEADESDGSFLLLNPIMSIITNIDNDHLDYYGNVENIEAAFEEFVNKIPFYGYVAINIDDTRSINLIPKIKRPYITYGVSEKVGDITADYQALDIKFTESGSQFTVKYENETYSSEISLTGNHNVLNALAAIAIAHRLGERSLKDICNTTAKFQGVGRRFEILHKTDDLIVVDDYGHHPTELMATIETARSRFKDKKIIGIFEPHRFTRTKEFWKEFRDSFKDIDEIYIADIYPASEQPINGIDSKRLINEINELYSNAKYLSNWNELEDIFDKYSGKSNVILSMGAGSISNQTRQKLESWTSKK